MNEATAISAWNTRTPSSAGSATAEFDVREFEEDAFRSMEVQICGETRTVQFTTSDHGGDHPTSPSVAIDWDEAIGLADWIISRTGAGPQTVEVTDEMVERAEAAFYEMQEGPLQFTKGMRAALAAALRSSGAAQGWRDISTAPKDGTEVLVWCDEGIDIARYSERKEDAPDDMGHDAGWWGVCQPMDPGRSMGAPAYTREAENQPWAWMPQPEPPYDDEGEPLFPKASMISSTVPGGGK